MTAWWGHDAVRSERLRRSLADRCPDPSTWLDALPVGVLVVSSSGAIESANVEAARLLAGAGSDDRRSDNLTDVLGLRSAVQVRACIAAAMSGEPARADVT